LALIRAAVSVGHDNASNTCQGSTLGMDQATYYNWHKSLGLVALVVAVARLLNRSDG
jgi:cytochrome b561